MSANEEVAFDVLLYSFFYFSSRDSAARIDADDAHVAAADAVSSLVDLLFRAHAMLHGQPDGLPDRHSHRHSYQNRRATQRPGNKLRRADLKQV